MEVFEEIRRFIANDGLAVTIIGLAMYFVFQVGSIKIYEMRKSARAKHYKTLVADLSTHPFFIRVRNFLGLELPALDVPSPLRREIAKSCLGVYWKKISEAVEYLAFQIDLNKISRDDFNTLIVGKLSEAMRLAYDVMEHAEQMPHVAVVEFRRHRNPVERLIMAQIGAFFAAPMLDDNVVVMAHILHTLKMDLDVSLITVVDVFSSMNGELKGYTFKGFAS